MKDYRTAVFESPWGRCVLHTGRTRYTHRLGQIADGIVELAAINENERGEIEKHQRDHGGREARIIGDVGVSELREIASKGDAADQPEKQRGRNSWQDVPHPPSSARKPLVNDHQ